MTNNALLALEDGTVFYGKSIGAEGAISGELIFNTSITGYQEVLTDPSYAGQIIVFTTPHIGNVGFNKEDEESTKIWTNGLIVRSYSSHTSNWRAEEPLHSALIANGVIGISDIDTRALTHIIRENGSQKCYLMAGKLDPELAIHKARDFSGLTGLDLTEKVTTKVPYSLIRNQEKKYHVVVLDFGVKRSILEKLLALGSRLTIVPSNTTAQEILNLSPDGVLLSNGPGDPTACTHAIETIKILLQREIPLFGICFGHQLLALASDGKIIKMEFGHHGANHPIIEIETNSVFISSQNHSFVVSPIDFPHTLSITHRSLFDGTIAGIKRTDKPAFGFQGHPEASPGPHDLAFLFQDFAEMMESSYAKTH